MPSLGYERASQVAQEALRSGLSVLDIVRQQGLLAPAHLEQLMSPQHLLGREAQPSSKEANHAP